jgi:DNA-binding MarR family transcriptional regulator
LSVPRGQQQLEDVLDTVLEASRVLVAISAQSIAPALDRVDVVQFRALVAVASREPCSLGGLAEAVGLHVSTASRTCDRLVAGGLLSRTPSPTDRRNLELTLTAEGHRLVSSVMQRRREALRVLLEKLEPRKRSRLTTALRDFAEAAGEPSERALWAMGWTTEQQEEPDD